MSFRVNHKSPLSMALMFGLGFAVTGGGIALAQGGGAPVPVANGSNGPAGDFPVVLGAPYAIAGTTYMPADTMNYDAVGHATIAPAAGTTISAAHHTLPLPSYVEVTSLETGRTILVRVERRGPMDGNAVIALSPGAAAQLGVGGGAAVRVRRVNPPEAERAILRAGGTAPARMDTPKPLLDVLNRRLNPDATVGLNAATQDAAPPVPAVRSMPAPPHLAPASNVHAVAAIPAPPPAKPHLAVANPIPAPVPAKPHAAAPVPPHPAASLAPAAKPHPATASPAPETLKPTPNHAEAAKGDFVIQAGAFSDKAHATALAGRIGGEVSPSGHLWRVRKGPFASHAAAEAALGGIKTAGVGNAQILHAD